MFKALKSEGEKTRTVGLWYPSYTNPHLRDMSCFRFHGLYAYLMKSIKILVLGDSGCGKSAFVHLFARKSVSKQSGWTIGCNSEVSVRVYSVSLSVCGRLTLFVAPDSSSWRK
jgi:hypothetical protein